MLQIVCFVPETSVSCSLLKSVKPSGHYVYYSGHYMYRTVVTICTAQWSLYVPHSGHYVCRFGHYMYRTVVTICTARWSLYVPPVSHSAILRSAHAAVFMCLVWISEQTAIISLYSINSLVCITERKCVYCAVRTGSLNVLEVNPEQSVCCSCAVFRH